MKKKTAHILLSILVIFSGTFAVAPLAFCTIKIERQHSSCCERTVPAPAPKCPICVFDQNKVYPSQANFTITFSGIFRNVIAILPHESSLIGTAYIADYQSAHLIDTSPPLYLELGILRLWVNPFTKAVKYAAFTAGCSAIRLWIASIIFCCIIFTNFFWKDNFMKSVIFAFLLAGVFAIGAFGSTKTQTVASKTSADCTCCDCSKCCGTDCSSCTMGCCSK